MAAPCQNWDGELYLWDMWYRLSWFGSADCDLWHCVHYLTIPLQSVQLLNDGHMSEWWFTQANDGEMLVNDGKMSIYHTPISPSLTSISPSLTSILPSLAWSKPSFAHLTIIEKLHRLLCIQTADPNQFRGTHCKRQVKLKIIKQVVLQFNSKCFW